MLRSSTLPKSLIFRATARKKLSAERIAVGSRDEEKSENIGHQVTPASKTLHERLIELQVRNCSRSKSNYSRWRFKPSVEHACMLFGKRLVRPVSRWQNSKESSMATSKIYRCRRKTRGLFYLRDKSLHVIAKSGGVL